MERPACLLLFAVASGCVPVGPSADLDFAATGVGTVILHGGGTGPGETASDFQRFVDPLPPDAPVLHIAIAAPNDWEYDSMKAYATAFAPRPVTVVRTTEAGTNGQGDPETEARLAQHQARLTAEGITNVTVIADTNANSPAVIAAARSAVFYAASGGRESRFAHVPASALGRAIRDGVRVDGKIYHGRSAGAMASLGFLSSTALQEPLVPGLGLIPDATVLAHAERAVFQSPDGQTAPQYCTPLRAVGPGRATTAFGVISDSYVVIEGNSVRVPEPFTFSRNGQTMTVSEPLLVYRAQAPRPAGYEAQTTDTPYDATAVEAAFNCGNEVAAAIQARASSAAGGAIEIYYPGERTQL